MYDALPLKDYQQKVLDAVDKSISNFATYYQRAERNYKRDLEDGLETIHPDKSAYCNEAWEKLSKIIELPRYKDKKGRDVPNSYRDRVDGVGRKIPNICLKVPTGGGKTLLATCALQRIKQDYFKTNSGLVLWIVPSETIYTQTWDALRDKTHPYRKQLDLASGGRTKILARSDKFSIQDIENELCIMVLMLQSFNVSERSKDARKIYSDSGSYSSFFPEVDDYQANNNLINLVPNLVEEDMLNRDVIHGITIKQSLGNVFRLCRPIVIIDEEHRAKSEKAINNINDFNPSFILELSATPRDASNKLVDIGGQELKLEQMIKLPINVLTTETQDWRNTLELAHGKLLQLSKDAAKLQGTDGTYIRPIMVIIAEPKRKGENYDQVEEIKRYLMDKCQVLEDEIKIKLSELNEIKDENLLDKFCPVKYIITKDALREGWDCSFAYILTILAKKDSQTALTQYTGRVLRQPYAKTTSIQSLNESYIYCSQKDVNDAVSQIKEGLEREGMGDVSNEIHGSNDADNATRLKVKITRNNDYKDKIFVPQLNSVIGKDTITPFDYYRDILGLIDWNEFQVKESIVIADYTSVDTKGAKVDYKKDAKGQAEFDLVYEGKKTAFFNEQINFSLLTSQLTDKIPNPFIARQILKGAIDELRKKYSESVIAASGHDIARQIKDQAFKWMIDKSEQLFLQKLKNGKIILKLLATPYLNFNWELGDSREVYKNVDEMPALDWNKSIFQPQYRSNYNGLEKDAAAYINANEAIKWWHRLGVKGTEYSIQGWKKDKIYPDFLILHKDNKYIFVETKGNHLENPDSQYKAKVFEYLNKYNPKTIGEFKLLTEQKEISFNLVYQDEWKEELIKLLAV